MKIFSNAYIVLFACALILPVPLSSQDFHPLTLETAVEIAMQKNPLVLAAQKEVDAARGRAWGIWWLPDPSFSAEFEGIPTGDRIVGKGAFLVKSEAEKESFGAGHGH